MTSIFSSTHMSEQKIVLLGDDNVGKSSLLNRLVNPNRSIDCVHGSTEKVYSQAFERTTQENVLIKGEIWDHPGDLLTLTRTEDFLSSYFDNVDGIVLVYDVTDKESFEHLTTRWITMFEDHEKTSKFYSTPKILVGNKMDMSDRSVPIRYINKLCKNLNNIVHLEASALTGGGVQTVFDALIKEIESKKLSRVNGNGSPTSIIREPNYQTVEFDWKIPFKGPVEKVKSAEKNNIVENAIGFHFLCDSSRVLCYVDDS